MIARLNTTAWRMVLQTGAQVFLWVSGGRGFKLADTKREGPTQDCKLGQARRKDNGGAARPGHLESRRASCFKQSRSPSLESGCASCPLNPGARRVARIRVRVVLAHGMPLRDPGTAYRGRPAPTWPCGVRRSHGTGARGLGSLGGTNVANDTTRRSSGRPGWPARSPRLRGASPSSGPGPSFC